MVTLTGILTLRFWFAWWVTFCQTRLENTQDSVCTNLCGALHSGVFWQAWVFSVSVPPRLLHPRPSSTVFFHSVKFSVQITMALLWKIKKKNDSLKIRTATDNDSILNFFHKGWLEKTLCLSLHKIWKPWHSALAKRCKKFSRPTKLTMIVSLHVLCHRLAHCVLKADSTLNPPTGSVKYKALVHQQNTTEKTVNLFAEKAFTALVFVEITCYLTELFPFSLRIFSCEAH